MELSSLYPLLGLLICLPFIYVLKTSLVERTKWKMVSSFILRLLALCFLILALCKPYLTMDRQDRHVIYLIDLSESSDLDDVIKTIPAIKKNIEDLNANDTWTCFTFGNELKKTDLDKLKETIETWKKGRSDDSFRSQSLISTALLSSRMAFPSDKVKELKLFSDGLETGLGLKKAMSILKKEDIHLEYHKLKSISKPEASVISLTPSSPVAYYGEMVQLKAKFSANQDMKAKIKLLHRDVIIQTQDIELKKGTDNNVVIETLIDHSGTSKYAVELVPEKDYFPINNSASTSIEVQGRAKVLALHIKAPKLRALTRALKKQGIDLEVRGKMGMPNSMEELLKFDAIMLADMPATNLTHKQMQMIKNYVSEFGCGLIMTGSENSFGLGGYYKSPVEDVLPIVSRYEKEKEKPSLAMSLVIDKSGSMSGLPIRMARIASKATVELLSNRDKVAVIAFDSQAYPVCDMTSASDRESIMGSIDSISAGGGTNMYPAMLHGKEMLDSVPTRIKHMIILGDGQTSPAGLEELAAEMAHENITVSTVALGSGSHTTLLQSIANIGRGRYYQTNEPESIPRIFTRETMEASKSAIKEEPFSPNELDDAGFLDGLDMEDAPYLLGYIMTKSKPTAKVHMLTDTGEPLLATGRFGLGTSAAFTSDATELWAGEWLEWKDFGKFWAQLIRKVVRQNNSSGIRLHKKEYDHELVYTINRKNESGYPLNDVQWEATVMQEHGGKENVTVQETGLGQYQVRIPKNKTGKTTLLLKDLDHSKSKTVHHKIDYPKEYRLESEAPKEISSLPLWKQGGSELKTISSKVAAQNSFLIAGLMCMITGIFLRRI